MTGGEASMDLSAGPLLPHLSNALLDLRREVTHETLQKINKKGVYIPRLSH